MGRSNLRAPGAERYLAAALLAALAVLLRSLLDPWLEDRQPYATLYGVVPLTVWLAGYRPALLTAAIGAVAGDWLFVAPRGYLAISDVHQAVSLGAYVVACGMIIAFGEAWRRAAERAAASARRTAETLESITDGLIALDVEARCTFVNPEAERQLGNCRQDLLGNPLRDVHPGIRGTPLDEQIRRALDGQAPGEALSYDPESGRWYASRAYPSAGGGVTVYLRDVSDRRRAEDRLAAVMASIGDHLVCYDRQWRYTFVNDGAVRLLGRAREELLGRCIWELFPEAVGNQYYRHVHQAAGERRPIRAEQYSAILGRWLEYHIYPTDDGVTVFAADISAQKRAEQAQALLATVVESSEDAIVTKTLDGTITSWNHGAERLFGYTAAEAIGRSIDLVLPPDRRDEEREIVDRLRRGERVETFETTRITRDGHPVEISLTVSPLHDAAGRIVGASKVARDVGPRRRAERAAREAEALLRLIADNLPVLISYVDREFRYRLINHTYERWFQRGAAEITGRQVREVVGEAAWHTLQPYMERALGGEVVAFEDEVQYGVAGPRWVSGTYIPHVGQDGAVEGFAVLVTDLTARRRAEEDLKRLNAQLSEADRRKDEFLATLAHELRNPLAPIRSAVEVLRRKEPADPQLKAMRDIIDRQTRQMTRLVDDLLEVSRISGGRVQLRLERFPIASAVEQAVEAARPLIEAAGHEITVSVPEAPLDLEADLTRVTQILINLLNNAAKYTPPRGRIWLTVGCEDSVAVVAIRDTGVGIPPDELPRLFRMFAQVGPAPDGGQGIGLALVKGLVELHGGTVQAHSDGPGRGSEFVVRLPLAEAPAPSDGDEADSIRSSDAEPAVARRILVVDDNRDAADSLQMMLEFAGHQVSTAHDGVEALEAAAALRPDVVVLDIGLPRLNGYEVAQAIRRQPWGRDVFLIALTGWGHEEDKRLAAESGFTRHLTKPIDPLVLESLLRETAAIGKPAER